MTGGTEATGHEAEAKFQKMIHDEERHADFLEAQLHPIKEMVIGVYLAQQLQGR